MFPVAHVLYKCQPPCRVSMDWLTLSPPNWLQKANQTCNSQKLDLLDYAFVLLALQLTERFISLCMCKAAWDGKERFVKWHCQGKQQVIESPGTYWVKSTSCHWAQKHPSCDKVFFQTPPGMDCRYFMESLLIWSSPFFQIWETEI